MRRDQFAEALDLLLATLNRGMNSGHIPFDDHGDVPTPKFLFPDDFNICCLTCHIDGLKYGCESLSFDETQSVTTG